MRKRNAPEPAPVVALEGESFRDQDWEAIRDLAPEAPVKKSRRRRKGKHRRTSSSSSSPSVGKAEPPPLGSVGQLPSGLSSDEQPSGKWTLPEASAVLKDLAQKVSAPSPISGVPTWQLYAGGVLTLLLLIGVGRILLNSSDGTAPGSGGASPLPSAAAALDVDEPQEERTTIAPAVQEQPVPEVSTRPQPDVVAAGINGATIQVGAFRDRANAERLVEELRQKHDQVHVQQLDNDLYRVTMGPFLERQTADGIAEEIQSEMQLSTIVVTAPLVHVRVAAQ